MATSKRVEAVNEIAYLREMLSLSVIRAGMGPRNADRALERLNTIEDYIIRVKGAKA